MEHFVGLDVATLKTAVCVVDREGEIVFETEVETDPLYQRPFQLTCAQVREVMEVMAAGSFAKKFQALQQASTMSS